MFAYGSTFMLAAVAGRAGFGEKRQAEQHPESARCGCSERVVAGGELILDAPSQGCCVRRRGVEFLELLKDVAGAFGGWCSCWHYYAGAVLELQQALATAALAA